VTKFCVVAPTNILIGLKVHGMLGIHHLLLAHDVVKEENSNVYADIFEKRRWADTELVIMDNSVIETGSAVDLNMIADAIAITQPTCVVLPDVLLNGQDTIRDCRAALDLWPAKLGDRTKYMYVPQGKTMVEFIESASAPQLVDDERITHWGCPRNIVGKWGEYSRGLAIKILRELNPKRKIHMLGFSDRMRDDFLCATLPDVDSIDSAVPLRINTPFTPDVVPAPRGNWWDNALFSELTIHNVNAVRTMLNPIQFPPGGRR